MHIHRVPLKTRMARATYNREILAHTQIQIGKMEEWVEGERNGTSMEEIHANVGKMVEDLGSSRKNDGGSDG